MKKKHDLTTDPEFEIGDKVLVHRTQHQSNMSMKLEDKWIGPYYIHAKLDKGVYKLRNMDGRKVKDPINGNRLKLYKERQLEPQVVVAQKFYMAYYEKIQDKIAQIKADLVQVIESPATEISKTYKESDQFKDKIRVTYKAQQRAVRRKQRIPSIVQAYYLGELTKELTTQEIGKILQHNAKNLARKTRKVYQLFIEYGIEQIYHTQQLLLDDIVKLKQEDFDDIIMEGKRFKKIMREYLAEVQSY